MNETEIEYLANPKDRHFIRTLKNAAEIADSSNAEPIFQALLSNFDKKNKISTKTGHAILYAIASILQRPKCADVFVSSNFILDLPYGNPDYANIIFDIFHIVCKSDIDIFDDPVVEKFTQQISFNPTKSLTLIANYALHFEYIRHPYSLLDVLINKYNVFLFSECASQFISLLSYLCTEIPDYRKNRSQKCWTLLAQFIEVGEATLVKQAFNELFAISKDNELIHSCFSFLKVQQVVRHLKDKYLRDEVLSFIAVCADQFSNSDLISALVEEAKSDTKAALVLMKLVSQEGNAIFLLTDDAWMQEELPTFLDSLKIVFAALNHKKAQKIASKSRRLIPLLIKASETNKLQVIVMILGILQKIELSDKKIQIMSKYGLFKNVIRVTDALHSDVADKVMYSIFECVSKTGYTAELLALANLASGDIIKGSELKNEALLLVRQMVKYTECIKQLEKEKLIRYFKKIRDQKQIDEISQQIIKTLRQKLPDFDKEDENDNDEYSDEEDEEYYENETYSE
ncbi:hypothetical protein TRFO_02962 [Tritrichomonas foetus]|uniref:Uncharacterized protein n=1 Tax=Tritrichomonas foetus TaxID=1144522 RepID=A0A1J4KU99_9EUKA|nr:hypothetical protein TRFO_02962 [Tritrichomonas foetus]|eukprot:OHT14714.1 hypothetical protein TRFO_02962 [Tritrichomonas foetus]